MKAPDSMQMEVAHVKAPTGEPSRAGGAGASAPMPPVLPAGESVEYVGLKESSGWRFTLNPQTAGEACEEGYAPNAPGYRLHTIAHSAASIDAMKRAIEQNPTAAWFVKSMEQRLARPADEWREAAWLASWLKAGLIRKATP